MARLLHQRIQLILRKDPRGTQQQPLRFQTLGKHPQQQIVLIHHFLETGFLGELAVVGDLLTAIQQRAVLLERLRIARLECLKRLLCLHGNTRVFPGRDAVVHRIQRIAFLQLLVERIQSIQSGLGEIPAPLR